MPRLTLTTRLVLAMMLVVTLVSGAILAVTRRSIGDAWTRMFESRFVSQIESMTGMQKLRLQNIQERCAELAKSDTVVRAMRSGDGQIPEATVRELTANARVVRDSIASFEQQSGAFRGRGRPPGSAGSRPDGPPGFPNSGAPQPADARPGVPATGAADSSPPAGTGDAGADRKSDTTTNGAANNGRRRFRIGPPDFIDLALIDPQGQVRSLRSGAEAKSQLTWLEANMLSGLPDTQMTGYLAADTPFGFRMPREVIITPVANPAGGEDLGALVVGVPMSTYGESAMHDLARPGKRGDLFTGLWISDELFSLSIPRNDRDAVTFAVREALRIDGPVTVNVGGLPHRLLFRSLNPGSPTPEAYQISLYSLEGLNADQARIRWTILGIAGAALALGLLLSWLLSRRLARPVRALVEGTRAIREGHYDTRVTTGTRDELADLAASFNEMAEGLTQRERYRSLLFQVSDDAIARQLMETACLGGERREVTVLFCDIRDFTATTAGMEPEGIIGMLNEHMTALTETVHRHHGVVDKFVGDLIMAIFGAPKSYGDDAGNAAACALEMMSRRHALNAHTEHPPLRIGIGLASGTAIAGCMGSENRLNYTVLGEPVNLASRLCSAAGPDEVIIDPVTRDLLEERAVTRALPPLRLKGFPKPVEPFCLAGFRDQPLGAAAEPPVPASA